MMCGKYQFSGAWIFPDGTLHMTSDFQSHYAVIDKLGLKEQLLEAGKKMKWSDSQTAKGFDHDASMIAMRTGIVRVTSFGNQIGIELGHFKHGHPQIIAIQGVCQDIIGNLWRDHHERLERIVVENFETQETMSVRSVEDAIKCVADLEVHEG